VTGESIGVAVAFSAGLFSFLSPCVLPLFPSYVSFITGMSVADLTADLSAAARRRVLAHAAAFVLGFSLVFVALGASFSAAGQFLLDYREWIRLGGGVLIVVFGLYIAGLFAWLERRRPIVAFALGLAVAASLGGTLGSQAVLLVAGLVVAAVVSEWLGRTGQVQLREKPAGYLGSLAVGVTFAIGWTPCVGPILGGILTLAGTADTVQAGIGLLVAYSAGLGLPFLISAAALGPFLAFFKRYRPFIPVVERAAGVILIVVGVLVFTNHYVVLNAWAISLTPDWLLKRL
jgi:cytochrome c-type biogenesis protein